MRVEQFGQFTTDIRALKEASDPSRLSQLLLDGIDPKKAKGQPLGDVFISLLLPAAPKVVDAADRAPSKPMTRFSSPSALV